MRAPCRPGLSRTLLSDDSRLSGCGADSSFRSDGAGAAAAGAVTCRARRAGPGDAGCPRSPGARGGQAWPGASGARVSRLSPCGPGPASCPGLAGRGLRAASLGGRERLAGRARWAGAPSPAVLTPSAAARGDVPPQDRVAAGLPEA